MESPQHEDVSSMMQVEAVVQGCVNWMQSHFPCMANSKSIKAQFEDITRIVRADDETLLLGMSLLMRYVDAHSGLPGKESEVVYLVVIALHLAQKVTRDQPIFNAIHCWSWHLSGHNLSRLALALALPRDLVEICLTPYLAFSS
ncbi:hypothetical protein PAPYR_2549 [Paratrimastix pyriformis]|uniref:Cyclin N-terminal domain-containing protein n=1 Tax=Paratrimastix pyriformis TaxID=342808 RepID=A0ABQ8UTP4_9EUKA|nr:hypothetical protein PAPYR_2549 [Paratrimastix pyriformis]